MSASATTPNLGLPQWAAGDPIKDYVRDEFNAAFLAIDNSVGNGGLWEEGTFVPAIALFGEAISVAHSVQLGTYTRIGRRIIFNAYVLTSTWTHTNAASVLVMNGLPATITSNPRQRLLFAAYISPYTYTGYSQISGCLNTSAYATACIFLAQPTSGGYAELITGAKVPSGTQIEVAVSGSYLID